MADDSNNKDKDLLFSSACSRFRPLPVPLLAAARVSSCPVLKSDVLLGARDTKSLKRFLLASRTYRCDPYVCNNDKTSPNLVKVSIT